MLHHVTREIAPELLERTVDFYALLGFTEVPTPPGIGDRARWLEREGTQIHLMPVDGAQPGPGHLAVVLPEYGRRLARLRAAGHAVEDRQPHWGAPRAYARDPAGNLAEVMESPPRRAA
ncbi:MAG TPA: VOC family protein [Solirubrobacteraceae bacterium]|nr:VOC family protein [Solirubrobacteraceae bacterium]